VSDRVTANLPSRDFGATAAFYARLGFTVGYRSEAWMILDRGPLEIEFFPHPGLDPAASWFSACVRVAELDALRAGWETAGVPVAEGAVPRMTGTTRIAPDLRMFAVVDPDGSLLRCLGP
jgi:catechol 2,3-dioxygenase-like lactoylglutathione lyase family enzyme